jgi:galactose mutarotase-like enzyme
MHGAGKPDNLEPRDKIGWDRSELIMFPIIGKPKDNTVTMNGHKYILDAHGISRSIPFSIEEVLEAPQGNKDFAYISQVHGGGSVNNIKYTGNQENPEKIEWPEFSIDKYVQVLPNHVNILFTVQNLSEKSMNYRFGWHPAFRLQGTNEDAVFEVAALKTPSTQLNMNDIIEASKSGAYLLPDVKSIKYTDKKSNSGVKMILYGFDKAMIWTKSADSGMFCLEPVTQLPDKNREYLDNVDHEYLESNKRQGYGIDIIPF